MFPILIPKSLKLSSTGPSIITLNNYTSLSDDQFFAKLTETCNEAGVNTALGYIEKWNNFDSLKEGEKVRFVKEIEEPEYFTFKARFKRALKIIA
jgi:hypothetical protein